MLGRRLFISVVVFVSLSGCRLWPKGDIFLRVTGRLSGEIGMEGGVCDLKMYSAKFDRLVGRKSVDEGFEADFVLPAGAAEYYFQVDCSNGNVYKTKLYKLGDRSYYKPPLDLGDL